MHIIDGCLDYKKAQKLALTLLEGNVHIVQQHRSQSLSSVNKLAVYDSIEAYKQQELDILVRLNLTTNNSIDFLAQAREELRVLWAQVEREEKEREEQKSEDDLVNVDKTSSYTEISNLIRKAMRD